MLRANFSFTDKGLITKDDGGPTVKGHRVNNGFNAHRSSKGVTTMRVFCHEHQRSFFAPRQTPIKCENKAHVLGELDFAGNRKQEKTRTGVEYDTNSPFKFQWQYCCNCEHFCLINFDDHGLQRCPVCTRRSSNVFICDRCFTVSFESITSIPTKNFTIKEDGIPRPCCPGCLLAASPDLNEHTCEIASVNFLTGLSVCPICDEALDVAPAFPSSVAHYLRRTKTANKTYATFDYETELFIPIEDGEFVIITNNDDTGREFLVPRSPRLTEAREFYELYQDYYHCTAPKVGAINIAAPAILAKAGDGWKLKESGVFEMLDERKQGRFVSERKAREPRRASEKPVGETAPAPVDERSPIPAAREASLSTHARDTERIERETENAAVAIPCEQCQTPIEEKYAFCWRCGHERGKKKAASGDRPERLRLIVPAGENDEEPGMNRKRRGSLLSRPLSWAQLDSPGSPERRTGTQRSVLKLFGVGIIGLLSFSIVVVAMIRSRSTPTAATVSQAVTDPTQSVPTAEPRQAAAPNAQTKATPEMRALKAEDAALERLRLLRAVESRNPSKILQRFSETERKYANDYRFPYERARVLAAERKKKSHEEAFAALARAAEKAIHNGKASEMLQNMNKDSAGDFQNLSHGYREWVQLQKALKTNDASMVSEEAF
ncbi:MAG TPA: hypothetical protein VLA93_15365 [Pyrinomonadaceae bacterium]|nr:hypothetical protein [Pyrinomonadaceae bacterium]